MDRSLLLLMKLRFGALFRRWKKSLSRPKGIILAVITALIFIPWFITVIVTSRVGIVLPMDKIHRFMPIALFVFASGSLLFAAGEQALYYSPAEITFLFAGPYRKRQLVSYKLFVTVILSLISAIFFTLMSSAMSPRLISAFVGSFTIILFLQTLQMAVGLAGATLGTLAMSRGRRWIVVVLIVMVALAVVSVGREVVGLTPLKALEAIERSPVARVALTPFRWFVLAFTSDRIWPDLIQWSALSGLIDLGLIVLIYALDASYLEAASTLSSRRFAKLQRVGGGGGGLRSMGKRPTGRFRFRPPNPPWWGGVGPNFWRQVTMALGDPGRMISVVVMLAFVPLGMIVMMPNDPQMNESGPYICLGTISWMSIILSFLIPYDFRGDVDLMEELKALPIAPSRLALGQLLTPTLLATTSQALAILVVLSWFNQVGMLGWSFLAFLLPVNFLFYAIENLLFLWYPTRIVAGQFDVMAVGRQALFMMAKMLALGLSLGLSAGIGVGAYFLTGQRIVPALVASWVVMVLGALGMLPLVARAFARFDVTNDIPA